MWLYYRPHDAYLVARFDNVYILISQIRRLVLLIRTRGKEMVMEKIDFAKAKKIALTKGLKPGKVKGTEGVQFTKGSNNRLDVISWEEFEAALSKRGLAIYESGGWMKIMKA